MSYWGVTEDEFEVDRINYIVFTQQQWVGLQRGEVEGKMRKLFPNFEVSYSFVDQLTDEDSEMLNCVEFRVNNGTVIEVQWGVFNKSAQN